MKNNNFLLWLDEKQATDASAVGMKAARLAISHQAGLPVPPAFILTIDAFTTGMTEEVQDTLRRAYQRLQSAAPSHLTPSPIAVRSSATAEDLEGASFAGMQETVLNVKSEEEMLVAVRRVWASVESASARAYRTQTGLESSQMAVLIQLQVRATVAGVAFGNDPIRGDEAYIIEAVAGLGDQLVSGKVDPQRWRIALADHNHTREELKLQAPKKPLLNREELTKLITLLQRARELFGAPQDIEWASDGSELWMLQTRPITGREDWFTDHLTNDHHLWCAAFLNERFTQPVSPLGWSMIAQPLERLALRGPLDLLGVSQIDGPLLKLWRGHPYSRVEAWQRIYKLFFDWMLPDDAERYFPEGDVSLRNAPRQPTYGWHLLWNGLQVLKQNFHAASPFHNPEAWARYEKEQAAAMKSFCFAERQLTHQANPIPAARHLLQQVASLTDKLLELHRWSLLYADLSYSLLRRWLIMCYGATEGARRAVKLTTNVSSPTTEMNRILSVLAAQVAQNDLIGKPLKKLADSRVTIEELRVTIDEMTNESQSSTMRAFWIDLEQFLVHYGHRFFSLDFYDPPWEADIPAFARFLLTLSIEHEGITASLVEKERITQSTSSHHFLHAYMRLREAQRFHWQQLLALQRRVVLVMGKWWVEHGFLADQEHVFGLTYDELMTDQPNQEEAAARMKRLHRLREQARQAPGWHYPDFLRGNKPLIIASYAFHESSQLQARAVSPGIARGTARLIAHPSDFERLRPGDILVTTSPDPGWTPIFGTIAGLVTERGGQLSHGAIVAREYGLPAVSGITGVFGILQEGEMLLVDGTQGIVVRLASHEKE